MEKGRLKRHCSFLLPRFINHQVALRTNDRISPYNDHSILIATGHLAPTAPAQVSDGCRVALEHSGEHHIRAHGRDGED